MPRYPRRGTRRLMRLRYGDRKSAQLALGVRLRLGTHCEQPLMVGAGSSGEPIRLRHSQWMARAALLAIGMSVVLMIVIGVLGPMPLSLS
jgi:hypothetical protein